MTTSTWSSRYSSALMNTFGPPRMTLTHGDGTHVTDEHGTTYLDMLGGIAVNSLGHNHRAVVEAVTNQLQQLGHISNLFASQPQIDLAERLLEISVPGGAPEASRVFLTNSGSEANETALKIVLAAGGKRRRIIALDGAFHGRTLGALAMTAKEAFRTPFEPLGPQVTFVPAGDAEAVRRELANGDVAGVIVEAIQGEAGVRPMPAGFLAEVRAATEQAGALLVVDEVQTGIGRCGQWMGHHLPELGEPIVPDVITLAKGLGGGMPIGAAIAIGQRAATALGPGSHGNTFGGNPVCSAAALAVLTTVGAPGFLDQVRQRELALREGIAAQDHAGVTDVRGAGLLLGIGLRTDSAPAVRDAFEQRGVIVNPVAPNAIRLAPALTLSQDDVEEFLTAARGALAEADQ